MKFQYKIYGLQIESSRRINLLSEETSGAATDLSVVWTPDLTQTPDAAVEWKKVTTDDMKQRIGVALWESAVTAAGVFRKLRFNTRFYCVDFILDESGENLWAVYDERELETDLDSLFVGPILGCIMRLRGVVCLHASAVSLDGRAIIITGEKRGGKSTTAAEFARLGHQILADDVAVITSTTYSHDDRQYLVQPGYPKVRLRPEPLAALFREVEAASLPLVYSGSDFNSRYISLKPETDFCAEPLPLGAIYVLGERDERHVAPFVEPVEAREKLINLTKNTFGSYVVYKELRTKEFAFLAELARTMPIRRLMFGNDLRTLPQQCQAIIEDFRQLND